MLDILRQGLAAQGLDETKAEPLEAFARALETRSDLRLALVGDGPLRPQIEADIDRLGLRWIAGSNQR